MLQQKIPEDFVIASGIQHSVKDFIEISANHLGMNIKWKGKGANEVGIFEGKKIIEIDSRYYRPTEVESLVGDASKAKRKLGWKAKTSIEDLAKEMIENDSKEAMKEKIIIEQGID